MPCRTIHVIAGLAEQDGGPSYSVPALANALVDAGCTVTLRTMIRTGMIDLGRHAFEFACYPPAENPVSKMLRASSDLRRSIARDAAIGAVIHAHGLWLMPNVYPAWARRKFPGTARLIHSPRGMLGREAFRISAWKKWPFWSLMQRDALEAADCMHATAVSEYEEIRRAGLRKPVAIIPNGIDIPDVLERPCNDGGKQVALYLGRIHPKKGLDRLVRAWATLESEFPAWCVRIIGPAELRYDEELRALVASLGVTRISIEGPIYGRSEKLAAYRTADLFVLPTLNENFGMTVAEALAAEVAVISTKGAPWAGLEQEGCGWWIDQGVDPLVATMRTAMAGPREDLHSMGARGRAWMRREFSWNRVAREMMDVYSWLMTGGQPPSSVQLD